MQGAELIFINATGDSIIFSVRRPEYIYSDDQRQTIYSEEVVTMSKEQISRMLCELKYNDSFKDVVKEYVRDFITSSEFRNTVMQYAGDMYNMMKYSEENK